MSMDFEQYIISKDSKAKGLKTLSKPNWDISLIFKIGRKKHEIKLANHEYELLQGNINKKEEYKPVNAHPVNTEIEKTPEKTKAVEKKNTNVKSETPVVKSEPIIKNKIENKDSNITYKIQISSSSRKLTKAEKNKLYNGTVKFEEDIVKGYYKYLLGNFKTKDEANKFRSKIGIKGAFIVKYKLGKRL